ncbi:MAG: UvrD-helicase domain-containing protein, partial [Firmicutes bacterium]|nr:UvrD-helicase domain-containing protein [Bacillota bacterium]
MKFTENQLNAINTDNQNILVSAGAGSGKTSVLTNRVLRKLNDGISIDRLIILTFTNAAADEMKDRIKKTILLNPKLHNEMKRLDNAIISTFDAFCLRLVKTYHYRLNLPGTIQISDHVILEKAKRFCLDETLKKYYGEKTPLFKNLISRLFDKGDELLQTTILSFASGIEMIPDMFDFLSSYETNYLSNESIEKALTDFEKMIFSDIAEMNPFLDELIQDFKIYNDDKINQYLLEMSSNYQRLFKSIDLDEIIQLLQNFNHPRIPRFHKEFDENITDSLKQKNSDIKNKLNSIIGYFDKLFVKNKKDILKSIKETNCIILSVVQITKDYLTLLKDYKKRNSIFSFTDIMNYSIELFENCPDVTQYYQKNISEIMIDEYQDTNDLQEYLISLIQHSNLFMVGDIKQSIYGFRNANPDNFRMKRKQYKETNLGIAIDLMENFRSRKEVLNGVNQLFITIMDEKIGGVNYHENQSLIYGNFEYDLEFSAFQDYTPTILTYDNESLEAFDSKTNSAYIEGLIIAKDIRFKIDSGFQIFNREDKKYELATYQDFVILIDRKSNFDQYQKALIKYKVPVEKIADEDFSQSTEILFLNQYITLLKCFNDDLFFSKHFKGSFYGVARSFVYQIPVEQLIQLFLDYPKITKNIILELSEMNSFKQIINDLNIIVEKMYKVPAHKLLQMIYDQLQLFKSVAMLDNPEVAEAKLDFLIAKVEELAYFSVN